jgi:MSHA pilin protein MshA
MRKLQKGFTLIELVVVITILGILAAFAVPRFASLDSAARISATNGLTGSLRSAAALAHSVALINGTATLATSSVTMEGVTVATVYGYPAFGTNTTGIAAALNDFTSFTWGGTSPTATFQLSNGGSATCGASYTQATAALPPVITSATGGC